MFKQLSGRKPPLPHLTIEAELRKSYPRRRGCGARYSSSVQLTSGDVETESKSGSRLLCLPDHLQVLILDQLDIKDMRHVALTCPQFLALVSGYGCWANERIISVGSYLGVWPACAILGDAVDHPCPKPLNFVSST